jgi:putative phosphoesterase
MPVELEPFAQNRKGGLQAEGGVGNGSLQHLKLILCDHLVQRCHLFHILFLFLIQIKILPGSIPAFVFLFLFILCSRPEKMTEGGKKHMIRGNNDFFSYLPAEEEFWIGKKKVFITHGHSYYVSMETEQIREEGAARNADIIMFGHTHRPYFEERDGITVLNPGSLSFPRQEGRRGSYMILETDGEEKYEFVQHFL